MLKHAAAQKSKWHNLQYDEGGNHMAETETETADNNIVRSIFYSYLFQ
jgi:hypothetical protein